jgi:hypothetical protein
MVNGLLEALELLLFEPRVSSPPSNRPLARVLSLTSGLDCLDPNYGEKRVLADGYSVHGD